MKPADAILKQKEVAVQASAPQRWKNETQIPYNVKVRYLCAAGELEGGKRRRVTDPIWSVETYGINEVVKKKKQEIQFCTT